MILESERPGFKGLALFFNVCGNLGKSFDLSVLIIYCCITNHPNVSGIKEHTFVI